MVSLHGCQEKLQRISLHYWKKNLIYPSSLDHFLHFGKSRTLFQSQKPMTTVIHLTTGSYVYYLSWANCWRNMFTTLLPSMCLQGCVLLLLYIFFGSPAAWNKYHLKPLERAPKYPKTSVACLQDMCADNAGDAVHLKNCSNVNLDNSWQYKNDKHVPVLHCTCRSHSLTEKAKQSLKKPAS